MPLAHTGLPDIRHWMFKGGLVLACGHSVLPQVNWRERRMINGGDILFRPERLAGAATTPGGRCSAAMTSGARQ